MSPVEVRELKRRLTHYLRCIKAGKNLLVMEGERPIAVIRPIPSAPFLGRLESRLAVLAAQGRVTLPTRRPRRRLTPVKVSGPPVSRTILEDRR